MNRRALFGRAWRATEPSSPSKQYIRFLATTSLGDAMRAIDRKCTAAARGSVVMGRRVDMVMCLWWWVVGGGWWVRPAAGRRWLAVGDTADTGPMPTSWWRVVGFSMSLRNEAYVSCLDDMSRHVGDICN